MNKSDQGKNKKGVPYHRLSSIVQHTVSVGIVPAAYQAFDFPIEIFNKALAVTHFVSEIFELPTLPISIFDLLQLLESVSGRKIKKKTQTLRTITTDEQMGKI